MHTALPLAVEDSDQIVPPTSRKVFVAVDENGNRIGETHPNAKLTNAQVDEMRDLYEEQNWTTPKLAERFGISYIAARKIVTYERRATTIAGWRVVLLHIPTP